MILTPCGSCHLVHCFLDYSGESIVKAVGSLAVLEIYVGILGRSAEVGMLRVHGAPAEFCNFIHVEHREHCAIEDHVDCLQFV